jgi:hypothetical protein
VVAFRIDSTGPPPWVTGPSPPGAWKGVRRVLEQGDYVILRMKIQILVGQEVTVIPPAFHLASIIIRHALIFDTPRLGFVDSPA